MRSSCSNTSGWIGIPFYVSVTRIDQVIDEAFLVQAIGERLRAIGIRSLDPSDTIQSNVNILPGVTDTKAGDDLFPGPSTLNHRTGENGYTIPVHDSSKPNSVNTGYTAQLSNGDECPIGRFIVGHIQLLNDLNRELIHLPIAVGAVESRRSNRKRCFVRVSLSQGTNVFSSFWRLLIMKSLVQH